MDLFYGIGLLLLALSFFSLFCKYAPFGDKAMSGLAAAAVSSFLVEAIHVYIAGDFFGIHFLREAAWLQVQWGGQLLPHW